ncbi:MAG: ABC transporter permease subunit [Spirochaetaceae bacterium]|jgi:NitT/TauT family transport system permease protein|nr:ABC transporter permease subunit [Spirochaetaceae bacterium]
MKNKRRFQWQTFLPAAALLAVFLAHQYIPVHPEYHVKLLPYFGWALEALLVFFVLWAAAGLVFPGTAKTLVFKAPFFAAAFLFLGGYDLFTIKLNLLPGLFFPAPERILDAFRKEWLFILRCLAYSLRLLILGYLSGAFAGILTGTIIGWSARCNYWIMPVIRTIGPIPSTAWIPIALVVFTKPAAAGIFLIALGVWFPTTILTSSGILNVRKTYFEVSSTLGAGSLRNILSIALPAAAPSIFTGLFNGTASSFLTLMAAEMIGCKYGIGWYINWQRDVLAYSQVYAALIVIAVTFSVLIGLQFKLQNKALSWQKGLIRW